MLKKLLMLVLLVLSINCLLLVGGIGYLVGTGAITKEKWPELSAILFPKPEPPPEVKPVEAPDPALNQPILRIDELLARQAGRPATEQVQFIREAFDAQTANLERQRRELVDLRRQLDMARAALARDRADLEAREKALVARTEAMNKASDDKGFAAALALYDSLPTKQTKDIFMSLDEETVARFLHAMEPRKASRILKEFKTAEELARAQTLLERMRKNDLGQEATASSDATSQ